MSAAGKNDDYCCNTKTYTGIAFLEMKQIEHYIVSDLNRPCQMIRSIFADHRSSEENVCLIHSL